MRYYFAVSTRSARERDAQWQHSRDAEVKADTLHEAQHILDSEIRQYTSPRESDWKFTLITVTKE